jgi:hypothetical protein
LTGKIKLITTLGLMVGAILKEQCENMIIVAQNDTKSEIRFRNMAKTYLLMENTVCDKCKNGC